MKCPYCHQPLIPDLQAQVMVELPEGEVAVHEHPCGAIIRQELKKNKLWEVLKRLSAACIILFLTLPIYAEDVKGCYVTYYPQSGKFAYEPFLKVADKTSPNEDGEPEIWGFRPWNLEPPDKDGKTHPVNILDSRFIPRGEAKEVRTGSMKRMLRCPDFW